MNQPEYAGFWIRTAASLIDTVLIMIVMWPVLRLIYGPMDLESGLVPPARSDTLISYILPAIVIIAFWIYRSATPGKIALGLRIVDANTGGRPSTGQFIGRYIAYYVSAILLLLGFIWVGIDKRKQGFHDKLAGTVVVRGSAAEPGGLEDSVQR